MRRLGRMRRRRVQCCPLTLDDMCVCVWVGFPRPWLGCQLPERKSGEPRLLVLLWHDQLCTPALLKTSRWCLKTFVATASKRSASGDCARDLRHAVGLVERCTAHEHFQEVRRGPLEMSTLTSPFSDPERQYRGNASRRRSLWTAKKHKKDKRLSVVRGNSSTHSLLCSHCYLILWHEL